MYRDHFELREMPFSGAADPRFFFQTPEHEEAFAGLLYGVTQHRGIMLLVGPPGSGKTFLGQMLAEQLRRCADVAVLPHVPENANDLIASICIELGINDQRNQTTGYLMRRLRAHLTERLHAGRVVAVILDEAQDLGPEAIEHLRFLANMEKRGVRLLQILLLGQPEFLETLQRPEHEQLRQRIGVSCRLGCLDLTQTREYIRHRLAVAGASADEVFSGQAIDTIHEKSRGLPRLINEIADAALMAAYSQDQRQVDEAAVNECAEGLLAASGNRRSVGEPPDTATAAPPALPAVVSRNEFTAHFDTAVAHGDLLARRLLDSLQAGSEIVGRLNEANRLAADQSGRLDGCIHEAEAVARTLERVQGTCGSTIAEAEPIATRFQRLIAEAQSVALDLGDIQTRAQASLGNLRAAIEQVQALSEATSVADALAEKLTRQATEFTDQITAQTTGAQEALECLRATRAAADESADRLTQIVETSRTATDASLQEIAGAVATARAAAQDLTAATTAAEAAATKLALETTSCADQLAARTADAHAAGDRLAKSQVTADDSARELASTIEAARDVVQDLDAHSTTAAGVAQELADLQTAGQQTAKEARQAVEQAAASAADVASAVADARLTAHDVLNLAGQAGDLRTSLTHLTFAGREQCRRLAESTAAARDLGEQVHGIIQDMAAFCRLFQDTRVATETVIRELASLLERAPKQVKLLREESQAARKAEFSLARTRREADFASARTERPRTIRPTTPKRSVTL